MKSESESQKSKRRIRRGGRRRRRSICKMRIKCPGLNSQMPTVEKTWTWLCRKSEKSENWRGFSSF